MGKRGPKRKNGIKREANGRPSRKPGDVAERLNQAHDRDERETLSVGLQARERVFGIDPKESRNQMAGSFLGRLVLQKQISRAQFDAGMSWLDSSDRYQWAMGSPRSPGAVNLNAVHGAATGVENIGASVAAKARHEAAMRAVQAKQIELRGSANLFGALDVCVVRDQPIEHLVGDLRMALNALSRHYGLEARRAA